MEHLVANISSPKVHELHDHIERTGSVELNWNKKSFSLYWYIRRWLYLFISLLCFVKAFVLLQNRNKFTINYRSCSITFRNELFRLCEPELNYVVIFNYFTFPSPNWNISSENCNLYFNFYLNPSGKIQWKTLLDVSERGKAGGHEPPLFPLPYHHIWLFRANLLV